MGLEILGFLTWHYQADEKIQLEQLPIFDVETFDFYQHREDQFYIALDSAKQEQCVRLLNKHHIHHIYIVPQLWNVFKGEMSLVGPRPITRQELERYGDAAEYYRIAKPGMTGLWQVSGRSQLSFQTRIALDSWYVRNWSLWYDIAILCKTVRVVLKRQGAY